MISNRFEEMPTNKYVESSFWNFDALFQPQQHPARDAHDTFFLLGMPYNQFFQDTDSRLVVWNDTSTNILDHFLVYQIPPMPLISPTWNT